MHAILGSLTIICILIISDKHCALCLNICIHSTILLLFETILHDVKYPRGFVSNLPQNSHFRVDDASLQNVERGPCRPQIRLTDAVRADTLYREMSWESTREDMDEEVVY